MECFSIAQPQSFHTIRELPVALLVNSDLGGVVKIKLRMKKRLIIISSKENHFKRIFRMGTCEHLEVPGFGLTKAGALRHAHVWAAVCSTHSVRRSDSIY